MKTFVLHVFCAAIVRRFETICVNLQLQNRNGSVAQLNRASDSGSEGRGFESHRNHPGGAVVSTAPFFVFRAERLGREKVLKVVGLNPTGITKVAEVSGLRSTRSGSINVLMEFLFAAEAGDLRYGY